MEIGAEWAPQEDRPHTWAGGLDGGPRYFDGGTHVKLRVCVLSLDEVERQELAHWAGNVQRTRGITEALFRTAGLVRDWMRYDARPVAPLYEPVRVLSAADDIYTV